MIRRNIHDLRKNYGINSMHENTLPKDPFSLFDEWFVQAKNAHIIEPNAMVLATTSNNNKPSLRTVLLKAYSEEGFTFFTNYESKKANDIAANPYVSLLFLWVDIERQIRIEGVAKKVSRRISEEYFEKRPRESCINAWASNQSAEIESKEQLIERQNFYTQKFKNKTVPCPEFWGGYMVMPHYFEFWQGGSERFHDRIIYKKLEKSWERSRLAP